MLYHVIQSMLLCCHTQQVDVGSGGLFLFALLDSSFSTTTQCFRNIPSFHAPGTPLAPPGQKADKKLAAVLKSSGIEQLGGPALLEPTICGPEGACSGHGVCETAEGVCHCQSGWAGAFCEVPRCPGFEKTGKDCGGNGLCSGVGECECAPGFSGLDCAKKVCLYECGEHGKCGEDGQCVCLQGWTGGNCKVGGGSVIGERARRPQLIIDGNVS